MRSLLKLPISSVCVILQMWQTCLLSFLEPMGIFFSGQLYLSRKPVATGTGWTWEQMNNYVEPEAVNPHSNRSSECVKRAPPVVKGLHPSKALGVPSRLSGKEKYKPLSNNTHATLK